MNSAKNLTPEKTCRNTTEETFEKVKKEAVGQITYGFTNDYMFRAVFQKNTKALKGLLCAVLKRRPEEIISCEITNPIILGESIGEKTCVLDIRIRLNKNEKLNLEMQIGNLENWPKRSVYYLCTMYTDLKKGQDYKDTMPCVHIGFVSQSPFPDCHEFVSRYLLMNPENGHIYGNDISLIMVDLSLADETLSLPSVKELQKDNSELRQWARLFRAGSWEEAMNLATKSETMKEAVVTLRELSEEDKIKMQCQARMFYQGDMRSAREEGLKKGIQRINTLFQNLIRDNRLEDLARSTTDSDYQQKLLEEYGLSDKTE